MLTKNLLAALGIAGALTVGAADASANPWRGPVYRPAPVVVAPVYRAPVVVRPVVAPVYTAPVYSAPVYTAPVYSAPVYTAPVYTGPRVVVAPAPVYGPFYRPVGWHHHHWARPYYRW